MAQIIIDIKNIKNGLQVDINQTIQAIEKEEHLLVEIILIALENKIDLYGEGLNYNVYKTEIKKTSSNNLIVNRLIEYDL